MRPSLTNLKHFKFSGGTFVGSNTLLQSFESRIRSGNDHSSFSFGGPHQRSIVKKLKSTTPCIQDASSIALAASPVRTPTVAEQFAIVYTQQMENANQKKRRFESADLALLKQMTTKSITENEQTWEDLRREGHPIDSFVKEMDTVFVKKELRVGSDIAVHSASYDQLAASGQQSESLRVIDNAERQQLIDAEMFARVRSALSNATDEPLPTNQPNITNCGARSRVLTKTRFPKTSSGVFSDSDEEMVATVSLIGPLPTLGNKPLLLERVVDPAIVIAVKDVQETQMKAKQRRRLKLAKNLEGSSAKDIAKALTSSLSKNEIDRISKVLKKDKTAKVNGKSLAKPNHRNSSKQREVKK